MEINGLYKEQNFVEYYLKILTKQLLNMSKSAWIYSQLLKNAQILLKITLKITQYLEQYSQNNC